MGIAGRRVEDVVSNGWTKISSILISAPFRFPHVHCFFLRAPQSEGILEA